jgi:precorrin-2 dehydrogenase / sirohydrochlorin ferrochelatase
MSSLYPLFIKLSGQRCAVVGGGDVALKKVLGLIECGAEIRVMAPDCKPGLQQLHIKKKIEWLPREFQPNDLDGCRLVIAATNSAEVNKNVFKEANARGILCNVVDQPELCDFYSSAVVSRGDLQIAISTGGKSPQFAREIRHVLEKEFTEEYERALDLTEEFRQNVRKRYPDDSERRMSVVREHQHALELVQALKWHDREKTEAIQNEWKDALK